MEGDPVPGEVALEEEGVVGEAGSRERGRGYRSLGKSGRGVVVGEDV